MPGFELFGKAEKKQVQDVLDTGVLMRYGFDTNRKGHWKAVELERALAERMQVNHVQLVSSGTAALTVALASAGVGFGDEVIMPTFTFVATFEAILSVGAIPVLVDIDATLTLDPKAVEAAITKNTKAVMPVHMCGSMANLGALHTLCQKRDLLLIEDACQAIGGSYREKPLGSYGDLGVFSFDYVKTITCGEGGAVVTNNLSYYKNADHFSDHGHTHLGNNRGVEGHPFLGYNYRISELHAAVGVAQIKRLDEFIGIQKEHYTVLKNALKRIDGVTFRVVPDGGVENYSFLNFFLPTTELAKKAEKAMAAEGLDSCFYWYDNNWHYYRKWDHLMELRSLGKLSKETKEQFKGRKHTDFSQSDHWMGRNISCLIKLGWSREEVAQRAQKMVEVLRQNLN